MLLIGTVVTGFLISQETDNIICILPEVGEDEERVAKFIPWESLGEELRVFNPAD